MTAWQTNSLTRPPLLILFRYFIYSARYIHNLNHKMYYSECIGPDGWPSPHGAHPTLPNTPCIRKLSCLLLPSWVLCVQSTIGGGAGKHEGKSIKSLRRYRQPFISVNVFEYNQQPTGSNSSKAIIKPNTHLPHTYGRVFNVDGEVADNREKKNGEQRNESTKLVVSPRLTRECVCGEMQNVPSHIVDELSGPICRFSFVCSSVFLFKVEIIY